MTRTSWIVFVLFLGVCVYVGISAGEPMSLGSFIVIGLLLFCFVFLYTQLYKFIFPSTKGNNTDKDITTVTFTVNITPEKQEEEKQAEEKQAEEKI